MKNNLIEPKKINWFFCLNDNASFFKEASKVAVFSTKGFEMNRFCVYAGDDQSYVDFLTANNVRVIRHTSLLADDIERNASSKKEESIWKGAFLRIDIPRIINDLNLFDDEYYLYTDCDVIFQKDPSKPLLELKPEYFSASSQTKRAVTPDFNSGIMWCNVKKMASTFDEFKKFVVDFKFKFNACDQGALNAFYRGKWNFLDFSFNWKPYWGINDSACIIHFHGPKPGHYTAYKNRLDEVIKPYMPMLNKNTLKEYEYYEEKYFKILRDKELSGLEIGKSEMNFKNVFFALTNRFIIFYGSLKNKIRLLKFNSFLKK